MKEYVERRIVINKMPTKEELEAFLRGMGGMVIVHFDTEKGEFVRIRPDEKNKTDQK